MERADYRYLAGALAFAITISNEDPSLVKKPNHTKLGAFEEAVIAESFAQRMSDKYENFDEQKFLELYFHMREIEHDDLMERLLD